MFHRKTGWQARDFMKRAIFLICGVCWFAFGLGFGFFLLQYAVHGEGLQVIVPRWPAFGQMVLPGSVLVGLVHVVGMFALSALSFVVGIGLFSRGWVSNRDDE
jgi:hypothetical protein